MTPQSTKPLVASTTFWGANTVGLTALIPLITPALNGEPAAIGQLVLVLLGYAATLLGRVRARSIIG